MLQFHQENRALVTLAVQSRASSRLLLFNDQLQLCGRRIGKAQTVISSLPPQAGEARRASPDRHPERSEESALAFSGIHVISPRLLPMITEDGVFSIIDVYLRLAAQGEKTLAFRADEYYWRDLGRPFDLAQAARDLEQKAFS